MKYIYVKSNCPKCELRRKEYKELGTEYVERDISRFKNPNIHKDDIDVTACMKMLMDDAALPIVVEG
jgi:hypothetical protein